MSKQINIIHVHPGVLRPNPWNSNYVSPENEAKLRASIERFGVYKPIICRETPTGLEILGGEHRARTAQEVGLETVPVVNLGPIDDKQAKAIGLADNGRYGDDDLAQLSKILRDIGAEDAVTFLPFEEKDLASIFAISDIDVDDLELPDDDLPKTSEPELRATATHQVMSFKVPLGDAEAVSNLIDKLIRVKGYDKGQDSKAAAGMALVDIVNTAKEHL